MMSSDLVNKRLAAKFLSVSPATLDRLTRREGLPYFKIGEGPKGSVRFRIGDLADYVEQRRRVNRVTATDSAEAK
jgi:hypothetical protein